MGCCLLPAVSPNVVTRFVAVRENEALDMSKAVLMEILDVKNAGFFFKEIVNREKTRASTRRHKAHQ